MRKRGLGRNALARRAAREQGLDLAQLVAQLDGESVPFKRAGDVALIAPALISGECLAFARGLRTRGDLSAAGEKGA